jgi:hypothetical protein
MSEHSHEIIRGITSALFLPEDRRIQGWIDQIAQKNKEVIDVKDPLGFWYDGQYFRPSWIGQGKYAKATLSESLHTEMDALVKDKKSIQDDKQYISQVLFSLIEPCSTYQDIRDTLPECLLDSVGNLSSLSRTKEAAFTIQNDERALRQYREILPKIEAYCAARLIY